jgi:DNA-binding MarR family transcriptional regulator
VPTLDHNAVAGSVTAEQVDAVMLAAQALVGVTVQSLTEFEDRVTLPQLRVLILVGQQGTLNLNALARAMKVHPSNATRACDRLVAAGLLSRSDAAGDRRNLALELTDDGKALIDTLVEHRRIAVGAVLAQVPASQRRAIAAAMRAFGQAAGQSAIGEAWKMGWSS